MASTEGNTEIPLKPVTVACEALTRSGGGFPPESLFALLAVDDRTTAYSARRALQASPAAGWLPTAIQSQNHRVFLECAMALLGTAPTPEQIDEILASCQARLEGFLSDADFLDLLRVVELCLRRGERSGDDLPALRERIALEYPSADATLNVSAESLDVRGRSRRKRRFAGRCRRRACCR